MLDVVYENVPITINANKSPTSRTDDEIRGDINFETFRTRTVDEINQSVFNETEILQASLFDDDGIIRQGNINEGNLDNAQDRNANIFGLEHMQNQEIMESRPKVKDAVLNMRSYDGRSMDVEEFIKDLDKAFTLTGARNESMFIDHVKMWKLKGEAESCCGSTAYNSLDEFKEDLRKYCGKTENVGTLVAKLERIYQFPNEKVFAYKERVSALVKHIKEMEKMQAPLKHP